MVSIWDKDVPKLNIDNVRIRAASLTEAWNTISTEYLVRSVLVASGRTPEGIPFNYESARCTVKDLYDALSTTYGLAWVQDELTGVVWFYPAETAYDRILTTKVHVAWNQLGLPMQSGILESLGAESATGISVKQWGTLFRNTFDYAVDVPAGTYTVRDLLNLCCAANPTKTFFAQVRHGRFFVTAVNLVSDEVRPVPAGALHLWDVEIRHGRGKGAPAQEHVMTALSDHDPEVRHAARNYLEAIIWSVPVDEWVNLRNSAVQTLWTCIGVTSVLVRSEEATHQASIETMERLATDDFLAECEPGLAAITALELARLTRNARALEIVRKRNLGANELAGVASDACRIVALSGYVRRALQAKSPDAIVGVLKPLSEVVRLPVAGKLEFELAT
jgi:hypothetical protein